MVSPNIIYGIDKHSGCYILFWKYIIVYYASFLIIIYNIIVIGTKQKKLLGIK